MISIVSLAALVALGYGIYILRHVLASVRRFRRTAKEIGTDVKDAVKGVLGISRKKRERD